MSLRARTLKQKARALNPLRPDVVRVEVLEIKGAKYTELSEWGKDIAKLFFSPPRCPFFQHTDRDLTLVLPW